MISLRAYVGSSILTKIELNVPLSLENPANGAETANQFYDSLMIAPLTFINKSFPDIDSQ
jgi:hypothetical protein